MRTGEFPHEIYGAKAANLARIEPILAEIEKDGRAHFGKVRVPEFTALPVSVYDYWKSGKLDGEEILKGYRWMKSVDPFGQFIIRSSAVLSEDGDQHMAAGVYESIVLPSAGPRMIDYASSLEKVFESTTTQTAQAYMESIGVDPEEEKMGIVLQRVPKNIWQLTTCNTVNAGSRSVIKASSRYVNADEDEPQGGHLWIGRKGIEKTKTDELYFAGQNPLHDLYHVPPDYRKTPLIPAAAMLRAAKISLAFESEFGGPVQTEFVANKEEWDDYIGQDRLYAVQARRLPESMVCGEEFGGFPEDGEAMLYRGRANMVINGLTAECTQDRISLTGGGELLNIADVDENSPNSRLVIYDASFAQHGVLDNLYSTIMDLNQQERSKLIFLIRNFDKAAGSSGGHLETFFTELGLPCVFFDPSKTSDDHTLLQPSNKVKVFSDGIEARVYKAQ